MSAELILAVVGVADGCIKLANKALSMGKAYRDAEEEIDKKIAILETVWVKLETQLKFLRRISDRGLLNDELAQCHFTLLQKLHGTLLQAVSQLDTAASSITSHSKSLKLFKPGKWKYALVKRSLDVLMTELEAWQSRFDPSWYLIILIGGSLLDPALQVVETNQQRTPDPTLALGPLANMLALRRAIEAGTGSTIERATALEFNASRLTGLQELTIQYTSARAAFRPGTSEFLIMEPVDLSSGVSPQSILDIRALAGRLQHIDPDTFGILRCEGLLQTHDPHSKRLTGVDVVYRAPSTTKEPVTLRQLLLDQEEVSLSAIVSLAKQLVRSVSYIHACDFVHKNIRPENIVLFPSEPPPAAARGGGGPTRTIGSAYLLGLTQFRSLAHRTNLLGDSAWHRNLYRHPARQGLRILDEYVMQHDIYSLGVCLLEIGLWRPLVRYCPTGACGSGDDAVRRGVNASVGVGVGACAAVVPEPGPALRLRSTLSDKVFERAHVGDRTGWVKEDLVAMARTLLPARMGEMYTAVVESCLTCLDEGNHEFGGLNGDERGLECVTVGVRFVERILARVEEIRV